MKREEIVTLTDELLKKVPYMKEQIKKLDPGVHGKRVKLYKRRLVKVRRAIGRLKDDEQRIICYRYFDMLTYTTIAQRIGCSKNTVPRRINKLLLNIGRVIFGMEEEFWKKIYSNNIY